MTTWLMEGLFLRILSRGGKTRRQKSQQHVQYSIACAPAKPYMCSRTITLKKASTNTYVAFLQRAAHQPLGRWPHNSWLKALLHLHALTQTNHHRRLLFLAHTPPQFASNLRTKRPLRAFGGGRLISKSQSLSYRQQNNGK